MRSTSCFIKGFAAVTDTSCNWFDEGCSKIFPMLTSLVLPFTGITLLLYPTKTSASSKGPAEVVLNEKLPSSLVSPLLTAWWVLAFCSATVTKPIGVLADESITVPCMVTVCAGPCASAINENNEQNKVRISGLMLGCLGI